MKFSVKSTAAVLPAMKASSVSAAHFLPPGRLQFDLIVIDEASQVAPEEALGVIARARQMVVVGDDKQLPPTNFFKMALNDDDESDDEDFTGRTRDFESILKLACVRGVSQRMLRWHYRSRHPSLIALSNKECYGGSLLLPPSPHTSGDGLGLSFVRTPAGHYDRGGSGRNLVEADLVAHAVEKHITECPDLSLGVACFSVAQREAIEDALYRRGLSIGAIAFRPHDEELFVKNLETVQGDERDVIFISVGYGKDAQGRMIANFGPVSTDGGERRLNVLITRARDKCVVFSSIGAADISVEIKARGTRMLREFLHYAESGHISAGTTGKADFDSPFEEAVALTLRRAGYQIEPQVGVSGFRVDLGVVHPDHRGQFVLGIECDGASYHSARSARDRDRLRQEILEALGWKLHRIWSTDWFRNPAREIDKAVAAIEAALASPPIRPAPGAASAAFATEFELAAPCVETQVAANELPPPLPKRSTPYREATLSYIPDVDLLTLNRRQLLEICMAVVKVEGPIHSDEVARRVREAFNLERTGRRILDSIAGALSVGRETGVLVADGDFWDLAGRSIEQPRDRRSAASSIRRADRIAPDEYRKAIHIALVDAVALSRDELIVETARCLGFERTGVDLQVEIGMQIDNLISRDEISETAAGVRIR
jgi:very-short-patch-repair endonuclease